jgi:hypothetical protein
LYQLLPPAGQTHITPGGFSYPGSASQGMFVGDYAVWLPNGTAIDLYDPLAGEALDNTVKVLGTDGVRQIGSAPFVGPHAFIWNSAPDSFIDLNPAGWTNSTGYGIDGDHQVGSASNSVGQGGGLEHAMTWNNSAASAVDLNPSAFLDSRAYGTDGVHQVGLGYNGSGAAFQALLWSGTSASAVNLNPSAFAQSQAYAVHGNQQVGEGDLAAGGTHALLWSGSAASAIDLNPTGFNGSIAFGTDGIRQVGFGSPNGSVGQGQALVWSGSPASAFNLQNVLPISGIWVDSAASTIDAGGNIYGIATGTFNGVTGDYAVEWSPVPEPISAGLLALGALGILVRPIRRKRSVLPCG